MAGAGDIVLMGPPGSGKGTQAKLLCDRHAWAHLATGDLFRDHLSRGTELGKLAEQHMSQGAYVPDEVTVSMVRGRLAEIPAATRIVFDGFPRTLAQAEALDGLLRERGRAIGHVVLIDVADDVLVERLSKRGRADDAPEVVRRRLEVYAQETRPAVERYAREGLVRHLPGVGTFDEVHRRLNECVA